MGGAAINTIAGHRSPCRTISMAAPCKRNGRKMSTELRRLHAHSVPTNVIGLCGIPRGSANPPRKNGANGWRWHAPPGSGGRAADTSQSIIVTGLMVSRAAPGSRREGSRDSILSVQGPRDRRQVLLRDQSRSRLHDPQTAQQVQGRRVRPLHFRSKGVARPAAGQFLRRGIQP